MVRGPLSVASVRRALLVLALCCVASVHASLLAYRAFANVDEAYAMALAERLLEGHRLYDGAISQRGPLMYYAYEALARAFGWDNLMGVRVSALLVAFSSVWVVSRTALRLWGNGAAIVATGIITYALTYGIPTYDRMALNGEYIQLPFLIFGVGALLGRGRDELHARTALAAGLSLGVAVGIKQSSFPHAALSLLCLALSAHRARVKLSLSFAVGLAAPIVAALARLWREGTLANAWYYMVEYNRDVHVGQIPVRESILPFFGAARENLLFTVATLVTMAFAARWLSRQRNPRLVAAQLQEPLVHLAVHFVVSVLAAATLRRFFAHYFIPSVALLAVIVAGVAHAYVEPVAKRAAGVIAAVLTFVTVTETYMIEKIDGEVAHGSAQKRMARYIANTVPPEERIFVWGFSPWLYTYAHRRPAGRFLFSTYPSGVVPWFHRKLPLEKASVVPNSQEQLVQDLETEKPLLIIDAGTIMLGRSLRTYAPLAALLHRDYCFVLRFEGHDVYRRQSVCANKAFPKVDQSYDFGGYPGVIPVPKTVDDDQSAWLWSVSGVPAFWDSDAARGWETLMRTPEREDGRRLAGSLPPSAPQP